LLEYTCAD